MNTSSGVSVAASYRGLFAQPVLRRLAIADVCARLPQGMVSITLLLVAAQHASMTAAGLVVAGYTLGQAVTAPLRGRLADRRGLLPVAAISGIGYALALLALLVSAMSRGPAGLLIGTAALAGLLNPPLSPGIRNLWSTHAGARLKQTAFALDAAVFDLAYITGPVLASALATGIVPAAALGVMLALTGAGVITIGGQSGRPDRPPEKRSRAGPLRSGALRELLVTAALANAALSATEVALTAYVRHHHALWASGPLLAEVSIGSILGSLLLGAKGTAAGSHQYRRLPRLLAGYTCGLAVLAAAGLYPPLLAVAAPLAGLCLGPTLATLFGAAASAAPHGGGTETQAWINSIMNGGAAGGAALAGFAAGRPVLALALAAAAAAAAAVSAGVTAAVNRPGPDGRDHHGPFGKKRDSTGAGRTVATDPEEVRPVAPTTARSAACGSQYRNPLAAGCALNSVMLSCTHEIHPPDADAEPADMTQAEPRTEASGLDALGEIEHQVLWLSTAIVHYANRVRPNPGGLKVGGHQASSASMVSIMTSLWFRHLRAADRVSVKPHASPVLHAINYLLGELDESYLPTLRAFGGLQSYPSRVKDPDPVDYSTGSVGIGATAPIWGAMARRYLNQRFLASVSGETTGRQYSLLGDAELDEGAVWEAIVDPGVAEMGEIVWVVDVNRQSLDRVVPGFATDRLRGMFTAAGWQVITLKYGRLLDELFARAGGDALRQRIDAMPNPEYQRLLRCDAAELRRRLPDGDPSIAGLISGLDDTALAAAIRNLGGHDLGALDAAYGAIDDDRPTIILAYTIKGHGLAVEAHPQNHSALLTDEQIRQLAAELGIDPDQPWNRPAAADPAGRLCAQTAGRLRRPQVSLSTPPQLPADLGRTPAGVATTQAALGRALLDLTRAAPEAAARVVTVSPDVSSSTNLGGWVNKVGVWSARERLDWFADDAETILHWREKPTGQHIELGIAETNLVGLLGELGATWSRWGQPLFPIGVLYDPFVERALEPWSFGIYAGGQSILVGTPSGVTLAPEGGAHQSITTPSIGIEQPGCITYEPAFAADTEWCLLASLARLGKPGGSSAYLRLSTRPVSQKLADVPADPAARERRRRQVVAGAYPLRRSEHPKVTIAAMGAVVPEALAAGERLDAAGTPADVVCVTSPGLLFRAVRARQGLADGESWILEQALPASRATPLVTVLDGHPHTLAFLATVNHVPLAALGVAQFGQSGSIEDLYRYNGIDTDSIIRAALDLVS